MKNSLKNKTQQKFFLIYFCPIYFLPAKNRLYFYHKFVIYLFFYQLYYFFLLIDYLLCFILINYKLKKIQCFVQQN